MIGSAMRIISKSKRPRDTEVACGRLIKIERIFDGSRWTCKSGGGQQRIRRRACQSPVQAYHCLGTSGSRRVLGAGRSQAALPIEAADHRDQSAIRAEGTID